VNSPQNLLIQPIYKILVKGPYSQHFIFKPKNGPNKLESYITLGWKVLQGENVLAC
jgi:hypothetical protein